MTRQLQTIDDPDVAFRVISHVYRVHIIALLEHGPAAPSDIARAIGVPVPRLSYHFKVLRDFDVIELVEKQQVLGAVKNVYRLVRKPVVSQDAWDKLPPIAREAMTAKSLDHMFHVAKAAAASSGMDKPHSITARRAMQLDGPGYQAASEVVQKLLKQLQAIERQSAERLDAHETTEEPATVIAMLFDTPDPALVQRLSSPHEAKPRRRRAPVA